MVFSGLLWLFCSLCLLAGRVLRVQPSSERTHMRGGQRNAANGDVSRMVPCVILTVTLHATVSHTVVVLQALPTSKLGAVANRPSSSSFQLLSLLCLLCVVVWLVAFGYLTLVTLPKSDAAAGWSLLLKQVLQAHIARGVAMPSLNFSKRSSSSFWGVRSLASASHANGLLMSSGRQKLRATMCTVRRQKFRAVIPVVRRRPLSWLIGRDGQMALQCSFNQLPEVAPQARMTPMLSRRMLSVTARDRRMAKLIVRAVLSTVPDPGAPVPNPASKGRPPGITAPALVSIAR